MMILPWNLQTGRSLCLAPLHARNGYAKKKKTSAAKM
jgi:hypothetical protein